MMTVGELKTTGSIERLNPMTTKEVAALLGTKHVKKHKGQFKYWVSYYWHAPEADKLAASVKAKIPQAVITDSGTHFHAFVGGASSGSAKDSYSWVTFTLNDADMPVSAGKVTKRYLKGKVTPNDLMGMRDIRDAKGWDEA